MRSSKETGTTAAPPRSTNSRRVIGVVTVGRSDYSIYLPLLRTIEGTPNLKLRLLVSGAHLASEFGLSVRAIEADGFEISERIEMLVSSDTPEGAAKSIGLGVIGFAQALARDKPDILLLLGDRFEMLAAAVAALPLRIPLAHLHGGEITEGAIDNSIRHAITKMAHLHFVATEEYARRIVQMGEEPWRITVSGAPSLDTLRAFVPLEAKQLEQMIGLPLQPAPLLVTYHPVTLEYGQAAYQIEQLLAALDAIGLPVIFTAPNADPEGRLIATAIQHYVRQHANAIFLKNLGTRAYFSLMQHASAMVGNSSSGIIEAASFHLPVVNIGNRQRGRLRPRNVLDVGHDAQAIIQAIRQAISPAFRAGLHDLNNPYGDGHAAERIVHVLRSVPLDSTLLVKRFWDLPGDTGRWQASPSDYAG